jgi:translation initiation factor 2B subunit (eIF-2B alpha/beta/delta family)
LFSELAKHGYSRRDTGTTLVFTIIEKLKEAAGTGGLERVAELYVSLAENLLKNRPASYGAVNALRHIGNYLLDHGLDGFTDYLEGLRRKYDEDCWEAARIAANRVVDGDVIFTISNSVCVRRTFKVLADKGVSFSVYVMESRPGMEGLDMASYLNDLGVETFLIVDSAARFFMKNADKAIVGAEAIAANGAIVGKVGTSLLSLDASESRVRVFVVAPLYKLSLETLHGELVKLPEADWRLLMSPDVRKELPENYAARAPLYDVTPPSYIDGIATEIGLFAPQAIPVIIKEIYGSFPPKARTLEEILMNVKERVRG